MEAVSDTTSDLSSRAQAYAELERIVHVALVDGDTCKETVNHILDIFPRLAGLLGYVKADGVVKQWAMPNHRDGGLIPGVDKIHATHYRLVGLWEVCDAEAE